MKLGFIGLGRMGQPMVQRLHQAGHSPIVYDANVAAIASVLEPGVEGAHNPAELAEKLPQPAVIWLMVPAEVIDSLLPTLYEKLGAGGIIIDGGNSNYRDSQRRAKQAAEHGLHFIDAGTSGGVLAASTGYCLMIGGDKDPVNTAAPLFEALAQDQGWRHVGPSGAGHYVKMIHNAIEYGLMESYAEGYRLLKEGDYQNLDLGVIGELWQHGSVISSLLNRLSAEALKQSPELEGIDGYVAESGETRWTLEFAKQHEIELPAIQAAFDVRVASQQGHANFATKLLAAMRHAFGGHKLNK